MADAARGLQRTHAEMRQERLVEARLYRGLCAVLGDTDFIPYTRGPQALSVKYQMVNS